MRGLRTLFLSGDDVQQKREEAIERLEQDEKDNALDYILTVDIFNEGVDLPAVNQIIMLRPTESPIVFIQQLGRGLRKFYEKEYVVILDFIGNYMNNFMIPIALSGDRSYNKDTIRKYVREGSRIIPGESTIHFDEISKSRIFSSIDASRTTKKMLMEKYQALKNRLGKIPSILDFYNYGEIDPLLLLEYTKESYHKFLQTADREYETCFTEEQETMLSYVSQLLANGKRPHELIILKMLIEDADGVIEKKQVKSTLEKEGIVFREKDYDSAISVLNNHWLNTPSDKKKYSNIEWFDKKEIETGMIVRIKSYFDSFQNVEFKKQLKDTILFGLR